MSARIIPIFSARKTHNEQAREQARRKDGKFGHYQLDTSSIDLDDTHLGEHEDPARWDAYTEHVDELYDTCFAFDHAMRHGSAEEKARASAFLKERLGNVPERDRTYYGELISDSEHTMGAMRDLVHSQLIFEHLARTKHLVADYHELEEGERGEHYRREEYVETAKRVRRTMRELHKQGAFPGTSGVRVTTSRYGISVTLEAEPAVPRVRPPDFYRASAAVAIEDRATQVARAFTTCGRFNGEEFPRYPRIYVDLRHPIENS